MPSPGEQGTATRLDADAAFTRLPRPAHDADPPGVRPGSERVPAVVGLVLLAAAPFGAWIRVTEAATPEAAPTSVTEVLGIDLALGWLLVAAAVGALVAAVALGRGRGLHGTAVVAGLVAVVLPAVFLVRVQADLDRAIDQAIAQADVATRTVELGWGGWAAMVGAGALALAVLMGVLSRIEHTRPARTPDPIVEGRLP